MIFYFLAARLIFFKLTPIPCCFFLKCENESFFSFELSGLRHPRILSIFPNKEIRHRLLNDYINLNRINEGFVDDFESQRLPLQFSGSSGSTNDGVQVYHLSRVLCSSLVSITSANCFTSPSNYQYIY